MMWLVLGVVILALAFYALFVDKRLPGGPPGPFFRVPILGSVVFLGKDPIKSVSQFRKKYGDVFEVTTAIGRMVYVCNLEIMEQIGKLENFSHRVSLYKLGIGEFEDWIRQGLGFQAGIIGSSGEVWRDQRRFALRQLKDFGFGKSSMEDQIAEEVKELIFDMKKKVQEDPKILIKQNFNVPLINSLWKIIAGKKLDMNDPKEKQKISDLADMFASFGVNSAIGMIFAFVPFWLGKKIKAMEDMKRLYTSLFSWFREEYEDHEKSWDPDTPNRDFIDAYVKERKKATEEKETTSSFYGEKGDRNYVNTLFDLFLAGSETTSTTLTFAILHMLHNPEPFKKAQRELDEVVGRSRLPNWDDYNNLPYFQAFMAEIMRIADVAPFAVMHRVDHDDKIGGYKIPAGTVVHFALTEVLNDPRYFPEPHKLRPERFLATEGEDTVFKPHPALVQFGVGKRECLGKNLAKMELFLFLSALLHQFNFEQVEGETPPDVNDCVVSVTRVPNPFNAKITLRN